MHRHGIHGRKFGRKTDQRLALTRGLMCSLIRYQSITTTLARAKEIRRDMEKLISMAKKGGLHNRRLVIKKLNDLEATKILFDLPQIRFPEIKVFDDGKCAFLADISPHVQLFAAPWHFLKGMCNKALHAGVAFAYGHDQPARSLTVYPAGDAFLFAFEHRAHY